ncbi:MAG: hypothetical protein Q8O12_02075 [Candidatus Omnitrophota bacterium]|nr:hypothetical protein [Candidatus Omnitrophota bacterium]
MIKHRTLISDYIFLGAIIAIVTLQPYFMHGSINFYETGLYLPQINELFHGKALYRDMFILRGPLEMLMPMSMMAIFGKHIGVLNAYFYFGTVLTLIICAIFALKIFRTRGFVYLFALVLTARTFPWSCYNVWGGIRFGLGISAIMLAANFLNKKKGLWLFLAGAMSGLAFWTSFEIGAFSFISVISMICLYSYFESKDMRSILRYAPVYISGFFIASAPFIVYLFLNNAFVSYVDTVKIVLTRMTDVFNVSLDFDTPKNFKEFLMSAVMPFNHNFKYTLPFFFYILIGALILKKIIKRKIAVSDIIVISIVIYGAFLYRGAFRDIEGPQYRMALQPLLLVMFLYIEEAYLFIKKKAGILTGYKKALAIFLMVLIPLYSVAFSFAKYDKRFFIFKEVKSLVLKKSHAAIPYADPFPEAIKSERAKGIVVPGPQAEEMDNVIRYISSRVKARDIVFTFPELGAYNFLTDTQPLGRFYSAEFSFIIPEWFNEMMADLKDKKPDFVICARDFSRLEPYRPTLGKYLDEVNGYLNENYRVAAAYSAVNILKRR